LQKAALFGSSLVQLVIKLMLCSFTTAHHKTAASL